jgi:membrane associated rhomboid family serine protease
MLEDRDYMRQPDFGPRANFTVGLLVACGIAFVLQCIFSGSLTPPADSRFALSLEGLKAGHVWQLITFQFMHASILHIVCNAWVIYMFGRELEFMLGSAKFLTLYLVSGVVGGLFQELAALAWPDYFGGPVVGASAGAFGLVAAYAILFPERELTLLLFFVLPIRLTARRLLLFSALLAIGGLCFRSTIANAAHLGGMVAGILITFIIQGRWRIPRLRLPARRATPPEFVVKRAGGKSLWHSSSIPPAEDLSADEYLQKEVDPILDKISASGIQSLTAREREILEKARSKMNKR